MSEEKTYWYGVERTKKGFRAVIVRQKDKAPPGVELKSTNDFAIAKAESEKACSNAILLPPFKEEEISPGCVAQHVDGGTEHWSVILKVNGNGDAVCVLFSSNPGWSKFYRKATREEIALAGFVTSKPTYLASAVRPVSSFVPVGLNFPIERCEELYREFFSGSKSAAGCKSPSYPRMRTR